MRLIGEVHLGVPRIAQARLSSHRMIHLGANCSPPRESRRLFIRCHAAWQPLVAALLSGTGYAVHEPQFPGLATSIRNAPPGGTLKYVTQTSTFSVVLRLTGR